MRARYPDIEGFVERDGVKVAYEVFGAGQSALVFAPTDPLVHSRAWKAQVPYLAQAFQVLTIDPRGNGKSDRPRSAAAYADTEFVADTIAVMDAAGIDQAVLVGHCTGAWTALLTASLHPGRVQDEHYDLWVGDEAWDVDYFLHENPELKRAPYAWMTNFVGWLPMPGGGDRERALTADYNAEMIEQIARFPRLRDRAIFVGNPSDVVPGGFGAGLPLIRDWVGQNYQFSGYVSGFDPIGPEERDAVRAELGYRPGEKICLVTVGGSGVGTGLLRRAAAACPAARQLVPGLRMILVTGPRIDPESLPAADGLEVRGYVHDLYRHLAACDLAVVQGGLTTTMELTACQRPFIYIPLRHHFEQNFHVRHRLAQYGAGRCLDYEQATPDLLAQAIAEEINRPVSYRPVETQGAERAAASLAELI